MMSQISAPGPTPTPHAQTKRAFADKETAAALTPTEMRARPDSRRSDRPIPKAYPCARRHRGRDSPGMMGHCCCYLLRHTIKRTRSPNRSKSQPVQNFGPDNYVPEGPVHGPRPRTAVRLAVTIAGSMRLLISSTAADERPARNDQSTHHSNLTPPPPRPTRQTYQHAFGWVALGSSSRTPASSRCCIHCRGRNWEHRSNLPHARPTVRSLPPTPH
jgi:hypothetical protein